MSLANFFLKKKLYQIVTIKNTLFQALNKDVGLYLSFAFKKEIKRGHVSNKADFKKAHTFSKTSKTGWPSWLRRATVNRKIVSSTLTLVVFF
jgi:Tfp pilus assembly major pilin PilA